MFWTPDGRALKGGRRWTRHQIVATDRRRASCRNGRKGDARRRTQGRSEVQFEGAEESNLAHGLYSPQRAVANFIFDPVAQE